MDGWQIFDIERAEDAADEWIIPATFEGLDDDDLQVWVNLRVRTDDDWEQVELLTVEIGAQRVYIGKEWELRVPIPMDAMREIPFAQLIARAQLIAQGHPVEMQGEAWRVPHYATLRNEWPNGDVQAVVKAVADVYHRAVIYGHPAQQAVQEAFTVSRSTAGRMISKARELGMIHVSSVVGRPRRKGTSNDGEDSTRDR